MSTRFPASSSLIRRTVRRVWRPHPGKPPVPNGACRKLSRRPSAPPYWRNIAPDLRQYAHTTDKDRHRLWILVLQAKKIPHRFFDRAPLPSLYVPPVATHAATHEILAFEKERPAPPPAQPPERHGLYWYAALLAALIPWHRLRWNGPFSFSDLPATPPDWLTAGGLDAYRVASSGEWWRTVTSLTLHADGAHLISNLVMGIIFGIPLCRFTGVGFGFLLTILAGALGNLATAHVRPAAFLSQGFSTAVFASVGLLAAFAAAFAVRHALASAFSPGPRTALKQGTLKALVPLGAGLGFLAMLGGSDAPNVDYLAHTTGLAAGIILGLATAFATPGLLTLRDGKNAALQGISLATAVILFALCWRLALGGE
jgi:Uncharacterized membrane protein (homolog of Drosophila rhomboid)